MATFTRKAIAKICGISPQRIKQLFDAGVISRNDDSSYPESAITQYITFLNKNDQREAKFRDLLDKERHREKKRENDAAEILVAPVDLLEDAVTRGVSEMKPILGRLPEIVTRHWPEISADQMRLVRQTVGECRSVLDQVELSLDDD